MRFWRITCLLASFGVLFLWTGYGVVQAAGPVSITVDGVTVQTDVPPYIDDNARTMVPARLVSEALGCYVEWHAGEQRVRIARPGIIVELDIGQQAARVNGTEQGMDTTAVIREGRTMVPLRFLAETFGLKVNWEQEQQTVAIQSPPPPPPPEPAANPRAGTVTVTGDLVNIRSGPGVDYSRLTQVAAGTRLSVLAEDGDWLQVEIPQGGKGWIAGWLVEFQGGIPSGETVLRDFAVPSGVTRSALIMKESVNVRSGPGVDYGIVARLTLGQQLVVLGERDNWFEVRLPDGGSGWLAGWLVAVRYDAQRQETAADKSRLAALISRWGPEGEQHMAGDLPAITGVEVERSGSGVLLKVNGSSALKLPASFRLENPSRLVFDFPACLVEEDPAPALQVNHGPVARFRLSRFDAGTVRIVADLQGSASYALTQDPDGRVITIQIRPIDPGGRVIVIDPGHGAFHEWGGSDPGAIGPTGLKERDVVRSISLELGNILLNEGYSVIYTRQGDTALTLEDRAATASISGAELLISVHANASTNRAAAGTMTFYHLASGRAPAGYIQVELLNRLQREDKGVRQANFLVLRSCPIPAVLVEVAYISNPAEEKLLADPAFQRRAAEAMALGIKRYLASRQ
ncbi:MAG: N-acetylmuramoyl-L-alanine amidase [Bacillota bacterium]